jgi:glyoxylase-like metal-dependent hydrolase (beta-lactamase superfamily II)
MAELKLNRELEFEYGKVAEVTPLIRRVVARNPSAFTLHGTGTYIVGRGRVAVIDPGPDDAAHVRALIDAVRGETVSQILVTHTHRDHSPAAAAFKAATGAPTYGFGPHGSGRLDAEGEGEGEEVEEGGDRDFVPDVRMREGDAVSGPGWRLEAVYTPGHTSNHLCFSLPEEATLFPGDHVMGWSTTIVSPPDGDMKRYIESLEKLTRRQEKRYWPTHGPAIEAPVVHVRALIAHRRQREAQIEACLKDGVGEIPAMVARMYTDVPKHLHKAAERSVLAHLIHMVETGRARTDGTPRAASRFRKP